MSRSMFQIQQVLAALGLCAAAVLPAAAQQIEVAQDNNAMTVTRDAETGKLRAATAAEHAALASAKARTAVRASPQVPVPMHHHSGAYGVSVTDDFIAAASLIAVKTADGKVVIEHGDPASVAKGEARVPTTHAPATE